MKKPYIKFYPRDWQANTELQTCSIAARGAWIEMICLMAQSERYGHLERNGKPITPDVMARLMRTDNHTLNPLIEELETSGVFSRCEKTGSIYSRRMVKDDALSDVFQESGRRGGNPALKSKTEDSIPIPTPNAIPITTLGLTPALNPTVKGKYDDDFERFWEAYPKKTAKKSAFNEWKKAKDKPPLSTILAAIETQKGWRKWIEGYILDPERWIKRGCWDDKPEAVAAQSNRTPVSHAPIDYSKGF